MHRLVLCVFILSLPALSACGPKPPPKVATLDTSEQSPRGADVDEAQQAAVRELLENFRRVHFETDSSMLSDDAKAALTANAGILQTHPDLRVEVQGHADERGTVDYNLALGQRRARRVTDWLQAHGVPGSHLRTVTYGEELPLVAGNDERAWSRNRRAEFRITSGGSAVVGTTD